MNPNLLQSPKNKFLQGMGGALPKPQIVNQLSQNKPMLPGLGGGSIASNVSATPATPVPTPTSPARQQFVQSQMETPTNPTPNPQTQPVSDVNSNAGKFSTGGMSAPDPSQSYKDAFSSYIQSLNPSSEETETRKYLSGLILGDKKQQGDALYRPGDTLTGANNEAANISRNNSYQIDSAANALNAFTDNRKAGSDVAKARADYEKSLLPSESGFNLNPGEIRYDNSGNKIAEGGEKPATLPASAQEYQYAVSQGYKGSYEQYQNDDANRKRSIVNVGTGSGLTPYQESTTFNNIVTKYNASPLIQAADRTPVLKSAVDNIRKNPSDAAQQLNLSYAYIQALDTYQSAVREGELSLVNSIDSKVGQLSNSVQQIQNGQIVRPEVAIQIANAAANLISTINTAAAKKAKSFQSQADVAKVGDQFKQFTGGFDASYDTPISTNTFSSQNANPLGI